jgi:diguanylate cyclase (GGDEF)-like protein
MAETAAASLGGAPLLVALCDPAANGEGRPGAWLAAAQMAMAAEDEGVASLVFAPPAGLRVPAALSLPPGGRIEAVLALGLPGPAEDPTAAARPPEHDLPAPGAEPYVATAIPRPADPAGHGDRQVLMSFMEILGAAARADDLDGLLETIAGALGRLFPVDGASLGLLEDGTIVVQEILRRGEAIRREGQRLPADRSHLMGWVIESRAPLWRNDVASELRFRESSPGAGLRSDMTIPLVTRGQVVGAFRVGCRRRHAFDPEDFEALQRCADLTAVAVETQRLLLATRRLAEMDGLTGIYNHRYFLGLLTQEVERARRADRPVALLMIDIDDFKIINDTHGHPAGDRALRHVAMLVAKALRRSDVVARYGGEEFVAILPEAAVAEAMEVAEKIRAGVESAPVALSSVPRPLRVRISVGVASLPEDATSEAGLVEAADRALYRAKRSGKNRVCHGGTA